jgi:hypothetical protein
MQDQDGTAVPSLSTLKAVYKPVWHIPLLSVQWINSWWWAQELSETCRVSWQSKFVKLVHLVGFIIKKFSLHLCISITNDFSSTHRYTTLFTPLLNPICFQICNVSYAMLVLPFTVQQCTQISSPCLYFISQLHSNMINAQNALSHDDKWSSSLNS